MRDLSGAAVGPAAAHSIVDRLDQGDRWEGHMTTRFGMPARRGH